MSEQPWFATANDLPLLDIPVDAREGVREKLRPILVRGQQEGVAVERGKCFQIAQMLVIAANGVLRYCEGSWQMQANIDRGYAFDHHAWATLDGHRIDLIGELYSFVRKESVPRQYKIAWECDYTTLVERVFKRMSHWTVHWYSLTKSSETNNNDCECDDCVGDRRFHGSLRELGQ